MILDAPNTESGEQHPQKCTLEHLVSKYNPKRWQIKKQGEVRKVLACYRCNHNRSVAETLALSRHELLMRSKGFSLKPKA